MLKDRRSHNNTHADRAAPPAARPTAARVTAGEISTGGSRPSETPRNVPANAETRGSMPSADRTGRYRMMVVAMISIMNVKPHTWAAKYVQRVIESIVD